MILLAWLAGSLALAAAVGGGVLTLQSLGSQSRLVARRLARPRALPGGPISAAAAAPAGGAADGLDRLVDAHIPGLRRRLLAAGAPFTPSQLVLGSLGAFGVLLIALTLAAIPALVALGLAVWGGLAGPVLVLSVLAAQRQQRFVQQMPQAVDLMARSLQAGHPVTTAMAVAARQMPDPMGPELSVVIAEMSLGLERDAALRNLLQRFPIPELRMFAASLEVTRETGGNVAETLLNLGETMRAKGQLRKKVAAISAEGRMSFWVVSILPLAVVGMLLLLAPSYFLEVASDPLFWPLMSAPPILWAIGALMIWRMINFKI